MISQAQALALTAIIENEAMPDIVRIAAIKEYAYLRDSQPAHIDYQRQDAEALYDLYEEWLETPH
jgi:hypothetical protein